MSNQNSSAWVGDPIPSNLPYTAPPVPCAAPVPWSVGVFGLDPNPALTAALHAHASALNANTAILARQVDALEKANRLQAERRSEKPSIFA